MITDVPNIAPVTIPTEGVAIVALALLLLQTPPDTVFDKVVVEPRHAIVIPVIAAGIAVTLTTSVA